MTESGVASVEVLVTMKDGSAHSIATTPAAFIDVCSFGMERADFPAPPWGAILFANPPVVELSITVAGPDIKFIRQYHPAPEETP